jgi:hypothetical protein
LASHGVGAILEPKGHAASGVRNYPVIDYQTMDEFIGRERLFRKTENEFLLLMPSEGKLEADERIIWLTVRDAISWLNEVPDEFGSFWECAMASPPEQK